MTNILNIYLNVCISLKESIIFRLLYLENSPMKMNEAKNLINMREWAKSKLYQLSSRKLVVKGIFDIHRI